MFSFLLIVFCGDVCSLNWPSSPHTSRLGPQPLMRPRYSPLDAGRDGEYRARIGTPRLETELTLLSVGI